MHASSNALSNRVNRPIPINGAEAIFLPLFDAKLHDISQLAVGANKGGVAEIQQSWDSCSLRGKARTITVQWTGIVPLDGYDAIRFFLSFPPAARLSGWAVIDDCRIELFRDIPGEKVPIEPTSPPLQRGGGNSILREFTLEFSQDEETDFIGALTWVGAVNLGKAPQLEPTLPYPPDWQGWLRLGAQAGVVNPWMASREQMESWKKRIREPEFVPVRERLEKLASEWDDYEPEKHLREFVPVDEGAYRYVRVRDRNRPCWDGPLKLLALAGYLCDRPDWTQKAARILLCFTWTPGWFEGPQGCLTGSDWHHVCFQESHTVLAILFAMQFLGDALLPQAREKALQRVEEAWKLVDARCAEPGYRWYMNQGLVFNSARVAGAIGLHANGRGESFAASINQCIRDHATVAQNYFSADGHCCEGPMYFEYSLRNAVVAWMAMAHRQGVPLGEVLPAHVKALSAYAEATLSTVYADCSLIPLGPVGYKHLPSGIIALLTQWCGWERGNQWLLREFGTGFSGLELSIVDVLALLDWPLEKARLMPQLGWEVCGCLPSGLGYFSWAKPYPGKLVLTAERPSQGHYHQDRGGIILEAGGRVLLPDPGMTNYANARAQSMKEPDWHNLARPVGLSMACSETIPPSSRPRARIERWETVDGEVRFRVDLSAIYGRPVERGIREGALLQRGDRGWLQLIDTWDFSESHSVEINFQSYTGWKIDASVGRAETEDGLTVQIEGKGQLKWQQLDDRFDWEYRPIFTLKVTTTANLHVTMHSEVSFPLVPDRRK